MVAAEGVGRKPVRHRGSHRENMPEDEGVEWVHAERGQRRQHFGGVMHLVQFPQRRDAVLEQMIDPVAELVAEEENQRDARALHELGQCRRRDRTDNGDEPLQNPVGEELIR